MTILSVKNYLLSKPAYGYYTIIYDMVMSGRFTNIKALKYFLVQLLKNRASDMIIDVFNFIVQEEEHNGRKITQNI